MKNNPQSISSIFWHKMIKPISNNFLVKTLQTNQAYFLVIFTAAALVSHVEERFQMVTDRKRKVKTKLKNKKYEKLTERSETLPHQQKLPILI